MKRVFVVMMIMCGVLSGPSLAGKGTESIRTEQRKGKKILKIKGRIKSRHVRFRKGKSVRSYYIVTPDVMKIPLPRSHVEHRDGTISGIYLRSWRGKDVELICEGRIKKDDKEGLVVTVKKIISLTAAKG